MQCSDIESVLENEGLSPLPESVRAHAATCSACSNLIADFSAILSVAEQLPAEVEPPKRVSLRNQLEAEGIIKVDSVAGVAAPQPSWMENLSRILRGRALATAAVGLVIIAAAFVQIKTPVDGPQIKDPSGPPHTAVIGPPPAPFVDKEPLGETGQVLRQEEQQVVVHTARQVGGFSGSNNIDRVDDSLRQNLASLNLFIEDCRHRLKEDPNDELAREYLAVAYQQKAELLSAMIDRGRSVN